MTQKISEPVFVTLVSNSPVKVEWKNRIYKITKIGLHHTYLKGRVLYHVFSVLSHTSFLRIVLDTSNLSWRLEEISDEF